MKRKLGAFTAVLGVFLFVSISADSEPDTGEKHFDGFRAADMVAPIPTKEYIPPPTPTPNVVHDAMEDSLKDLDVEIEYTEIEYEYIGTYYITAYNPWECGYNGENFPKGWSTASGTICHRADYEDRLYEPTTCAVDRRYHSFGELFYIEEFDRVFISEDVGPGVQGKHLDLFYEDYDSVISFPTGYYEVFSVEYEEVEIYLGDHE